MIDILLATHNGEKYLRSQLNSIIAQTCREWRLIIGDDSSCDGTRKIIEEYLKKFPERIIFRENSGELLGPVGNFSELFKLARADYVAFCDQDDVWFSSKLEENLRLIERMEKVYGGVPILVHSDLSVVDENLKVKQKSMIKSQKLRGDGNSLNRMLVQNGITGCAMMVNRRLVEVCKTIPKEAIMHDWWLGLVAAAFGKIGFLNKPLVFYRQHGSNAVGAKKVFSFGYFFDRMFNVEQTKANMKRTIDQAKMFLDGYCEQLNSSKRQKLESYIELENCRKMARIKKLLVGGFLKKGIVRKIGQILYI